MSATHEAAPDVTPDAAGERPAEPVTSAELEAVRAALAADYDVLREIGRGGMAIVYLARERELDREVAIKVLPSNFAFDEGFTERFLREARISGGLEHPHIVPVYRVGKSGTVTYFVMKYLRGRSLADLLEERGALPAADVRRVLAETASALGYAARRGIVHRDVKPDNIMLDEEGRCVVTDFGIARSASEARLTATGMTVGTPRYMSPEQARSKPLDGRSDLYSLGIVGYECMTGTTPFDGEDAFGILMAHIKSPVPRPALRSAEERELWAVIERLLAKEPEQRFQAAEDVIAALDARGATGRGAAYVPRPSGPIHQHDGDSSGPQSAAALDRALAAGVEMLRQQRPRLDAGLASLKAQKPKVDAGLAAGRAMVDAQRPAMAGAAQATGRAAQAAVDVVRRGHARFAAGGRRSWIALGAAIAVGTAGWYGLHVALTHRSRCPASSVASGGDSAAGSARARALTLLLDTPGRTRAGGDVEVYYDVCGLEAGTAYTARVTVTRNESGLKRLFGGAATGSVTETFDETASGPATRRHRSLDLDDMPAGSYTLTVSVTDARDRRRVREVAFRAR